MSSYVFPGFPTFLESAAKGLGHPESAASAGRIVPLTALSNLCAQASQSDPAHVEGILAKAVEFRDQLAVALQAAELMLADVEAGRSSSEPRGSGRPGVSGCLSLVARSSKGPQGALDLARNIIMTTYATDEDIALRASTDYSALCPRDQVLAVGSDGVFAASDLWTLTSTSADFAAYGLTPGLLARLTKPTTAFGANGELFAVQSVSTGAITLRRKGQAARMGQPPSPVAGLTNVEFAVRSLGPQIVLASYDLDRRFGIDNAIAGRRSMDLCDPRQLREAVVLTVLYKQYLDQSRQFAGRIADPSETPGDVYAAKARIAKSELDELIDRIALKWNEMDAANRAVATTRFSTRISR